MVLNVNFDIYLPFESLITGCVGRLQQQAVRRVYALSAVKTIALSRQGKISKFSHFMQLPAISNSGPNISGYWMGHKTNLWFGAWHPTPLIPSWSVVKHVGVHG
jgi:hypothetical protein